MKQSKKAAAVLAGAVGIGVGAALGAGAFVWRRKTAKALARLHRATSDSPAVNFASAELALLPGPVRRYFLFALTPGQRISHRVRIVQEGVFRLGGIEGGWSPFTAVEYFTAQPAGYLWNASIRIAPLARVQVQDSYIAGVGAMQVSVASLIPVVNQHGRPELAAGALHRYLAEAVWMPTALLPGQGVVWEAIDENAARATLTDGEVSVSLVFQFGDRGEILSAFTPERFRDLGGTPVPTPWRCHYGAYKRIDGMMIPQEGEAAWVLPEGRLPYCRLQIREIGFDGDGETESARQLHAQVVARTMPPHRRSEDYEPYGGEAGSVHALAGSGP